MNDAPTPLSRRHTLKLLTASAVMAGTKTAAASSGADYSADVDFLLAELPPKAGHFFAIKGIDWAAVSRQFKQEAKAVHDDIAHVKLCRRLVARLRDGHAALMDLKIAVPPEGGGRRFTGPRVHLFERDHEVFVRQAFSSAAQAGVTPGMQVQAIDDVPVLKWLDATVERLRDERGYSTEQTARYYACHTGLADWEGTRIKLQLLKNKKSGVITLTRSGGPNYVPIGPIFPPKDVKVIGRQLHGRTAAGFGYIHLRDIPETLPAQLDQMLGTMTDAKGLILDFRANGGGGCDHEAVFGRFIPKGKTWRHYTSSGDHPFGGPIAVIVDAGVRSAGETVAGMLKEDGRAWMIGDSATAGTSSQKEKLPVPSGLFSVYFSVASNKGRFNEGRGIEGIGVPPHQLTPYEPADLAAQVDTQIRLAEAFLQNGWPKDKVPWDGGI